MILENYIADAVNVIYGKPKRGKSFIAIEVTACFSAHEPFHGVALGRHGRSLYVAAEGGAGQIMKRLDALIKRRGWDGLTLETLEENWHLVDHRIDLMSRKSVEEFLAANPGRWGLIVIDTLARDMSGDENNTQDMNDVVAGLDHIRAATGAAIILVHHAGKDGKLRGSSALHGALDVLLQVYRKEDDGLTYMRVDDAATSLALRRRCAFDSWTAFWKAYGRHRLRRSLATGNATCGRCWSSCVPTRRAMRSGPINGRRHALALVYSATATASRRARHFAGLVTRSSSRGP